MPAILAALLLAAAPGPAPATTAPSAGAMASFPEGYLGRDRTPDASVFLPAPPAPGSAAAALDAAAYAQTRGLQGQPRWAMAAHDAVLGPEVVLGDFACALGARLDAANAPALVRLIGRAGRDAGRTAAHAKEVYRRPRPFVTTPAPTCVPPTEDLAKSWSYPSGHATYGWTVGLVLSELAADRAGPVLARARAYGESRVVCGVHYVSDVQQGRDNASAVVAVLHGEANFQADLTAAKAEVAAARAKGPAPDAGQCKVEADVLAPTPWASAR